MSLVRRLLVTLLLALAAVALGSTAGGRVARAQTQSVEKLIEKGQSFFDEQRYEESIQTLSAALMRPGTAKKERVEVFKLLAYNYIVLQQTLEADGAVRGLLVLDEDFELPETESPRFRDFFNNVRTKWEEEGKPGVAKGGQAVVLRKVKIKHDAPEQVDPDVAIKVNGSVEDPDSDVAELELFYRTGSKGKFISGKTRYKAGKFSGEIPGKLVQAPIVEYYVEAKGSDGLPVGNRGDAELPLRVAVAGDSIVSSPWLWVPLSVAVVAAVVIPVAVVTTRQNDSEVTVNVFDTAPTMFSFRF
jgi:hypothetical protein